MIGHTCLIFIHYNKVIDYRPCQDSSSQLLPYSPNISRKELCSQRATRNLEIHKQLDAVCRNAANASLYAVTGLPESTFWMNRFLSRFYPYEIVLTHAFTEIVKDPDEYAECASYPMCLFYPYMYKMLYEPDLNFSQFVVCSKPRDVFLIIPPPEQFMSFHCDDGSVIAAASHCDGYNDCPDSEDEHNCTDVCTLRSNDCFTSCIQPSCACSEFYYHCAEGGCIQYDKFCNGIIDCKRGDDETDCLKEVLQDPNIAISSPMQYFDSDFCYGGFDFLPCYSRTQCFPITSLCHYDSNNGEVSHCADGTHVYGPCEHIACNGKFKCFQSYCILTRKVCDGVVDCPDADDEECENMACPGHLRCYDTNYCVPPSEICDGIEHCPGNDDEYFCQHCPQGCICRGNIMSCSDIEHPKTIMLHTSPAALILFHSNALFYHVIKTQVHKLTSIYHVSLDKGELQSQFETQVNSMADFKSLRFLHITNQQLKQLSPYFIKCVLLQKLNMSFNMIHTIQENAFSHLENLKISFPYLK